MIYRHFVTVGSMTRLVCALISISLSVYFIRADSVVLGETPIRVSLTIVNELNSIESHYRLLNAATGLLRKLHAISTMFFSLPMSVCALRFLCDIFAKVNLEYFLKSQIWKNLYLVIFLKISTFENLSFENFNLHNSTSTEFIWNLQSSLFSKSCFQHNNEEKHSGVW